MIVDEADGESITFSANLELHQKTFLHLARPTPHWIKTHHCLPRLFDYVHAPAAHLRDLFVRSTQAPVSVEIPDHTDCCITLLRFHRTHVELPFEMISE